MFCSSLHITLFCYIVLLAIGLSDGVERHQTVSFSAEGWLGCIRLCSFAKVKVLTHSFKQVFFPVAGWWWIIPHEIVPLAPEIFNNP